MENTDRLIAGAINDLEGCRQVLDQIDRVVTEEYGSENFDKANEYSVSVKKLQKTIEVFKETYIDE